MTHDKSGRIQRLCHCAGNTLHEGEVRMEYGHSAALDQSALLMSRIRDRERTAESAVVSSLVQRTLGGDTAAFEELIVRYERRVFTLAMKLLGSTDDAQDAAQEVFLRVFKYIIRFDSNNPIGPWLVQVAVNFSHI